MSRAGEWNLWHFLELWCKLKNVHDTKNLLDSLSTLHLEDLKALCVLAVYRSTSLVQFNQ